MAPYFRDALEGIANVAYFFTGAEGPPLKAHSVAASRYFVDKADGEEGRSRMETELDRSRVLLSSMLKARSNQIALLGNASDALHRLAGSIHYPPGSNVVTSELEFPSGVHTLLALRARGVEVRIARSAGGRVSLDSYSRLIDHRTRLVIASHSSYINGAMVNAVGLRQLANEVDAPLVLDATQSLGVLPVAGSDADAIVASSYKWLLGPHGVGVLHVSSPDRFSEEIGAVGWRSVESIFTEDRHVAFHLRSDSRRFELGYPNILGTYLLNESLGLLATVSPEDLADHVARQSESLVARLVDLGAQLLTPRNPKHRGANVSIAHAHASSLAERLLRTGVRVWGGDGRLRFSIHGFVSDADIERAISALREA